MDDEETVPMKAIRSKRTDHQYHDHFMCATISEQARKALEKHNIEFDGAVIHFPKGVNNPGFGRSFVAYPDETDTVHVDRSWELPDGTFLEHSTKTGRIIVKGEEEEE